MSKFMLVLVLVLVAALVAAAVAFPSEQNEDLTVETAVNPRDSVDTIDVFQRASRYVDCGASKIYEKTPGMAEWCHEHCFNEPPFCPPAQCRCW